MTDEHYDKGTYPPMYFSNIKEYAEDHPELRFLVTRIGCGNAGYTANQIAPLFKRCIHLENVALPSDFWNVLGLKMGL